MTDVRENCLRILDRIHGAAARSGRDATSIKLIAVTKTVSPENIRQAAGCGILDVGENRLQEALAKQDALLDLGLTWHFIGHLQTNKAGIDEHGLASLIEQFRQYERLQLRGLMAIPPFFENPEGARPYFRRLRELAHGFGLVDLSMGMSHDFEVAIDEGATMVRIGTALFGER